MSLYDDASLIMYPSGYKSGKIYCQKPTDGSGDLTFTRASTATRVNEIGLIEAVASGVPRIDFTGGGCGKLLLEPQRTNKALWNRDMTNAVWGLVAAGTGIAPVVTSNYAVSPDGTMNADRVFFSTGGGTTSGDVSIINQSTTLTSGLNYGYSVWLKSNTGSTQKIKLRINSGIPYAEITVTTEWVRYSVIYPNATSGARDFGLDLRGNFATSADLLVWGFQLEENVSYITSLIPTEGSTVTRVADASITSGVSSVIGQTEGVLYVNASVFSDTESCRISLTDGTQRVTIDWSGSSGEIRAFIVSTISATICILNVLGVTKNQLNKVAFKYKNGDFALWLNGVEVDTDTSTGSMPPLSTLRFDDAFSTNLFKGKMQELMIFDSILSDAELEELTTL